MNVISFRCFEHLYCGSFKISLGYFKPFDIGTLNFEILSEGAKGFQGMPNLAPIELRPRNLVMITMIKEKNSYITYSIK